jgi:hypothetical protein
LLVGIELLLCDSAQQKHQGDQRNIDDNSGRSRSFALATRIQNAEVLELAILGRDATIELNFFHGAPSFDRRVLDRKVLKAFELNIRSHVSKPFERRP